MSFNLETHAELSCLAQGNGVMYSKKGAMIAYQGNFKFSKVLIDPNGKNIVSGVMNLAARKLTGENMELMEVKGQGAVYFADEAQHVTVINLNPGERLSVESENLLAFNDLLSYGIRMIGVGVISQKGLFTTKMEAKQVGAQVAVKTDGNPIILQTPCTVDPDAVVCWTGPDPKFKMDVNWKTLIGQTSGESYMLNFTEPGYAVIVQPSERLSGLRIGIDDKNYTPQGQAGTGVGNVFGGGNQVQGYNQQPAQSGPDLGDIANQVGNILNNFRR